MKSFIQTLQNIWRIKELRERIILTLLLIAAFRFGSYVVLPGVNPDALERYTSQAQEGLLGLFNLFVGGAFSRASIFALGIMPYISASIIIQLLGVALPYFQRLQREGESGRNKINQITRVLTVAITMVQSVGYLVNLRSQVPEALLPVVNPAAMSPFLFMVMNVILLTSGTIFVMWLGEKITERGVGNGISLMITIGILAALPTALAAEFEMKLGQAGGGLFLFLLEMVFLFLVTLGVVALVQATRRIPVQYARRVVGNRVYGGVRQFLPIKVNAAGVMPIIFAQALMFIPATIATFMPDSASGMVAVFSDYTSFWYNLTFAFLIIIFTYFYTAVTINPQQIADDLKRNGGFIPGVKPGRATVEFIDNVVSRITLPGAIFLALVAIMPTFAIMIGVSPAFARFFGGTSLLIMVGVMLDTLQQIESYLIMRHYDGLIKGGRVKGRYAMGGVI